MLHCILTFCNVKTFVLAKAILLLTICNIFLCKIVSDSYIFLKKITEGWSVWESGADTQASKTKAIGCLVRISSL